MTEAALTGAAANRIKKDADKSLRINFMPLSQVRTQAPGPALEAGSAYSKKPCHADECDSARAPNRIPGSSVKSRPLIIRHSDQKKRLENADQTFGVIKRLSTLAVLFYLLS